jgi:hypothetical protein
MINYSKDTPERRFENIIADLQRKIEELRTNQLGALVVPVLTSDPSSPVDGSVWVNSTSGQLKARIGGVTRVVTVT